MIRTVGIWALLLPGVVALQPAFGGWQGFIPGLAGITVGAAIGWASVRWRVSPALTVLALIVAYLAFGGAFALPRTTIAGFIPTPDTLRRLVLLIVDGWRDLLTVATPAGDFTGPAAVPWLAGLVFGLVGAVLAQRFVYWPLVLPPLFLALGIAFGVRAAPTAPWLGAALGVGIVAWVWLHRQATQRNDNADILVNDVSRAQTVRQGIAAAVIVAVAAVGTVSLTAATGARADRQVLREKIAPPLDLHAYPSPLTSYRLFEIDLKDTTLFTVTGMPKGARLRLASMDTYDGHVFNISQQAGQYLRTGRTVAQGVETNARVDIAVAEYSDVWLPQVGRLARLEFTTDRASQLVDSVYHNVTANQTLSTTRLAPDDAYRLDVAAAPEPTKEERAALGAKNAGPAPLAKLAGVPEALITAASEYTKEAKTDFERMVALEAKLSGEGYYSDGSDQKSRSGHTTERLASMFGSTVLVGDDEQYATAMAIMANQLGVPARVVLGFYPQAQPDGTWEVKGTEAHVWVEAQFADIGWLSFDPTPPRDRTLQTEVPKPKPKPKPQVDPPPNPPEKVLEKPLLADPDPSEGEGDDQFRIDWALVALIVGIAGGTLVISSPFLTILALKARRTARRRKAPEVRAAVAGGWLDIVDRARDLGHRLDLADTRREAAQRLQTTYPKVAVLPAATQIDAAIYGPGQLAPVAATEVWKQVDAVKQGMFAQVNWRRRVAAALSLRSLKRPKRTAKPKEVNDDDPS